MSRDPRWMASGERLVYRIMLRRKLKCQNYGTHTADWPLRCKACGVNY